MRSWRAVHTASASRYKRNTSCRMDGKDEGTIGGSKKKKNMPKKVHILAQQ